MTKIICGVDVACETLDASIGPAGPAGRFAATAEGIEALARFCREHRVELVAMEATGGYERRPFALLWAQGLPCAILNPRQVRRFAEAMGMLEKTDRIDARVIAAFAEVKRAAAVEPAGCDQLRLAALVTRLGQLTALRVGERNRRRLVEEPGLLAGFDEIAALIARQIRALEQDIAALIGADPLWAGFDRAFRSLKGVADRTVARVMAEMPEIGTISNKAAAKLAGLAPIARDSGKREGRRSVRGGRRGLRAVLFTVAEIVRRHEPDFADFHRRLSQAGKPKKVIRIALAHKLLTRLNAKARQVRAELANAA